MSSVRSVGIPMAKDVRFRRADSSPQQDLTVAGGIAHGDAGHGGTSGEGLAQLLATTVIDDKPALLQLAQFRLHDRAPNGQRGDFFRWLV